MLRTTASTKIATMTTLARITEASIKRMRMIPVIDATDESTVYVANVSFNDKPKNSFTIQNPGSLTWEANAVPAPVARATKAKFASG